MKKRNIVIFFILWIIYLAGSFWYFYFDKLYQQSELLKNLPKKTVIFEPDSLKNNIDFFKSKNFHHDNNFGYVFYIIDSSCPCSDSIDLSKMIQNSKNSYNNLFHYIIDFNQDSSLKFKIKNIIKPSIIIFDKNYQIKFYGYLTSSMPICSTTTNNIETASQSVLKSLNINQKVIYPVADQIVQGCFCN